jgi:two-component system chemotaxis response regulator CheY
MKRILVIDDSQSVRQQIGMALSAAGYEVIEATDGLDGIDKVSAGAGVSLVICDVNMPHMNGLEFLDAIRAQPRHAQLPVLMLTNEGQPNMIARAKAAGAKGWIVKPVKPELIISALNKLLAG